MLGEDGRISSARASTSSACSVACSARACALSCGSSTSSTVLPPLPSVARSVRTETLQRRAGFEIAVRVEQRAVCREHRQRFAARAEQDAARSASGSTLRAGSEAVTRMPATPPISTRAQAHTRARADVAQPLVFLRRRRKRFGKPCEIGAQRLIARENPLRQRGDARRVRARRRPTHSPRARGTHPPRRATPGSRSSREARGVRRG